MAADTDIVNVALTLLGESRISSIDDDIKPAREAKAIFDICRDALLSGYNWSFAKARVQLSAMADAPEFGWDYQYQLPPDCVRIISIGEYYVGAADLTDYRGSDTSAFTIEGKRILTNLGAPLYLQYVKSVTDTGQFDASFTKTFAAQLAMDLAEALTQSDTKRDRAEVAFKREINLAIRSNAIQLPPVKLPDDEWLRSRY